MLKKSCIEGFLPCLFQTQALCSSYGTAVGMRINKVALLSHRAQRSWLDRLLCHFLRHAEAWCSGILSVETLCVWQQRKSDILRIKAGGKGFHGGVRVEEKTEWYNWDKRKDCCVMVGLWWKHTHIHTHKHEQGGSKTWNKSTTHENALLIKGNPFFQLLFISLSFDVQVSGDRRSPSMTTGVQYTHMRTHMRTPSHTQTQ